jgi:hypothetical protein
MEYHCRNEEKEYWLLHFDSLALLFYSAKHSPQRCGVAHNLDDEDVVQIVTKTNAQQRQSKDYQQMVQGFSDKYHKKKYDAKKQKQSRLRR